MVFCRKSLVFALIVSAATVWAQDKSQKNELSSSERRSADTRISPSPIYIVNPRFPESRQKKISEGELLLRATVASDGAVKDVVVIAGEPILAGIAAEALRKWRYLPGMQGRTFIETTKDVSIKYKDAKDLSRPEEPLPDVPRGPKENLMQAIASGNLFRSGEVGVTVPKAIENPDPEYSETARKDGAQGTLQLGVVVGADGLPRYVWVVRPLGHGLNEEAIKSVRQWRFAPAAVNGQPVTTVVGVEVSFRLSGGYEPEFEYGAPSAVTLPIQTHTKPPEYSEQARRNHVEGTVVLNLTIGADGTPRDIRVFKSLGSGLDEKAVDAVRQWRWKPATEDGQPIAVPNTVSVVFRLH